MVDLRNEGVDIAAVLGQALRAQSTRRILYVVDGLPLPRLSGTTGVEDSCPAPDAVSLLVTTRRSGSLPQWVHSLPLIEPRLDDAVALLAAGLKPVPRREWEVIADWVGRLPLALTILNRALRDGGTSRTALYGFATGHAVVTTELDRQREALGTEVDDRYLKGVTEAFAVSYEALDDADRALARRIALNRTGSDGDSGPWNQAAAVTSSLRA